MGVNRLRGVGRATTPGRSPPLGASKGPMMKVAQMLATIPDALPDDYAAEMMR